MRLLSFIVGLFALLAVAGSAASFAYYWDSTRVLIKRYTEADPQRFEMIPQRLRRIDPEAHLNIRSVDDVKRVRDRLISVVWGVAGIPATWRPTTIQRNADSAETIFDCATRPDKQETALPLDCAFERYQSIDNLDGIDRLLISVHSGYVPTVTHFRPENSNGRLVLYQHGSSGTYHRMHRHIASLIKRGFGVMAFNAPGSGENLFPVAGAERTIDFGAPQPMRFAIEPIIVGLNYGQSRFDYKTADIIGFSDGGYIAGVAAAIDPRIRRSYLIASPYPIYLRTTATEGSLITRYPPMLEAATYLDQYVLGSTGAGRGQLQITNRFDSCCWSNRTAKLYERTVVRKVTELGKGDFSVIIDESHAGHKISNFAFQEILHDMERP